MATLEELARSNGHDTEQQAESEEQLDTVLKRLNELRRGDGVLVSMTKQELGLLQSILKTTTDKYHEEAIWRFFEFDDPDEAFDHVAAFEEALDLGLDTRWNISYANSLLAVNRRHGHNNLIASLLDTMQMGKWTQQPQSRGRKDGNANSRSILEK